MSSARRSRIAAAYLRTRLDAQRLKSRVALDAHQQRLWQKLSSSLRNVPALAALAGRPLDKFPVIDPAAMRGDIKAWNSLGLTREDVLAAAQAAEDGVALALPGGVQAGFSTGSEGARGLFITSPAERGDYIGTLLGKLTSPARLLRPLRCALILRANNRLYQDIGGAGAAFDFIGLDLAPAEQLARLKAFTPTHLVAPPHVLADLARLLEGDFWRPKLDGLFYGAEPIGSLERGWIAQVFGRRPDPLYQATEGFLGAPCAYGNLHLNEDGVIVEQEAVPGSDRFLPIITDLRRRSQPMVRVRLDDLIAPLDAPCPCGSPLLAVHGIEGRASDVWGFGEVAIFPREVDDCAEAALGPKAVWTAHGSPEGVRIETEANPAKALAALTGLLRQRGVQVPVTAEIGGDRQGPKRRRVRWSA